MIPDRSAGDSWTLHMLHPSSSRVCAYRLGRPFGIGLCTTGKAEQKSWAIILKLPAASNLSHDILLARAGLPTLTERRQFAQIKFCFNPLYRDSRLPEHLKQAVSVWTSSQTPWSHHMTLRGGSVRLPRPWTNCQNSSPFYSAFSLSKTSPSNV